MTFLMLTHYTDDLVKFVIYRSLFLSTCSFAVLCVPRGKTESTLLKHIVFQGIAYKIATVLL